MANPLKELVQNTRLSQVVDTTLSRRGFMAASSKISVASIAALGIAGSFAHIASLNQGTAIAVGYQTLRPQDVHFFESIAPVTLTDVRTEESVSLFLQSLDGMFLQTTDGSLGRIRNLLDLLTLSVTRPMMTGTFKDWHEISLDERDTILTSWKQSSFELPSLAYFVTIRIVCMAWFSVAGNQSLSGYPGPPIKLSDEPF